MSGGAPAVHATAVVVGEAGVLIRGPSGAGKTSLALALIEAASLRGLFARLVGDDRVLIEATHGRLIARPHPAITGQVERRGQGVHAVGHEDAAVLRAVVDFAAPVGGPGAPDRLPAADAERVVIEGVELPRLAVPAGLGAAETARVLMDFLLRRNP